MKRQFAVFMALLAGATLGVRAATDIPDDVKALTKAKCIRCHKGKFPPKGLNLEPANLAAIVDAPSREVPELKIVDSRTPESSYLLKKARRESGIAGKPMPPGKALAAEELRVLETWILGLKRFPPPVSAAGTPGYWSWKRTVTLKTADTGLPSTTTGS